MYRKLATSPYNLFLSPRIPIRANLENGGNLLEFYFCCDKWKIRQISTSPYNLFFLTHFYSSRFEKMVEIRLQLTFVAISGKSDNM